MGPTRRFLIASAAGVAAVIAYRIIFRSFSYQELGWGSVAWIELGLEDLALLAAIFVAAFVLTGTSRH
jgi:hypothetical protein